MSLQAQVIQLPLMFCERTIRVHSGNLVMTTNNDRYEKTSLFLAIKRAIETGEALQQPLIHAARLQRLDQLDTEQWIQTIALFPDLHPYQTLTEGIITTAQCLSLPLPPLEYRGPELLGHPRGVFSYAEEGVRSIHIYTFRGEIQQPFYAVNIFEGEQAYQANAPTLEDVTRVVSAWVIEHVPLDQLALTYAWMNATPINPTWRIRFE